LALASILFTLGALLGWGSQSWSWTDTPAPASWVIVSLLVVIALLPRVAVPVPLLIYVSVAALGLVGTLAVGSSLAAATWWPIVVLAFMFGRSSPAFVLGLVAAVLLRDAATLVILEVTPSRFTMSGSVQYFLGFIGAVGAPMWLAVSLARGAPPWRRSLSVLALVMVALSTWAVLASGSRAALLGLVAAIAAGVLYLAWSSPRRPVPWRRVAISMAVVVLLVPVIDVGLGRVVGNGGSTIVSALSRRTASTIREIETTVGATSSTTRIAFWSQALMAARERPLGHGLGSYGHVNHAYQNEPMLWNASPHSVWALAGVETGVLGTLALLALVIGGLLVAARRRSPAMPALLAGTAVMSLDIFSSMPLQGLLWWAVIGAAYGPGIGTQGPRRWLVSTALVGVLSVSVVLAVRFASPCDAGCKPLEYFAGHPRFVGTPTQLLGDDPTDPRWDVWGEYYPLAYWLAHARATAELTRDPTAMLSVLRMYPFQSPERYIDVADAFGGDPMARDVASCGLVRFFDGRTIWRDWRSSGAELTAYRMALVERAGASDGEEAACQRAGIPPVAIGLR
jgi:hypothetical protein